MKVILLSSVLLFSSTIANADVPHYSETNNFYDRACTNLVDKKINNTALTGYYRGVYDAIGWANKDVTEKKMIQRCKEADARGISFRNYVISIVKPKKVKTAKQTKSKLNDMKSKLNNQPQNFFSQ